MSQVEWLSMGAFIGASLTLDTPLLSLLLGCISVGALIYKDDLNG